MTAQAGVPVSARAAQRISTILAQESEDTKLRVSVTGGGCSGFQYNYDLVTDAEEDDIVIERDGAVVLVDSISLMYLAGSEIDFVDDLVGQAFQINNPNATAGCGCGTSFSM